MEIKAKEITFVDIESLIPNPKNNNKHPKEQIERLSKLIKYQGFRNPLVVSNRSGFVLCGHGRIEAAKLAGMKKVPVMYQDFENEAQEYAYLTSDNAIASWAELDLSAVNTEMLDLGPEFDVDLLGIKDFVIEPIEKFEPQSDEDEVPEVVHPITRRGDIWLLGNHRLMCGDSTMIDDVEKLMNGEKADMVFTDIPYSISQKSNGLRDLDYGEWDKNVQDIGLNSFYSHLAESFYYFCGDEQLSDLLKMFKESKLSTRCFVWKKPNPTVMNGEHIWLPSQELCAYGKKAGAIFNFKCQHAFFEGAPKGKRVHPNQKPIELVERCILASSDKSVIDLFAGSGSTMIASEKNNRKCFSMELTENYCDVIINRWQNYTGKKAVLELTKQTYEELKLERLNG